MNIPLAFVSSFFIGVAGPDRIAERLCGSFQRNSLQQIVRKEVFTFIYGKETLMPSFDDLSPGANTSVTFPV
jgi:hypothetical protein